MHRFSRCLVYISGVGAVARLGEVTVGTHVVFVPYMRAITLSNISARVSVK